MPAIILELESQNVSIIQGLDRIKVSKNHRPTDPDFQRNISYLTRRLTEMKHLHNTADCSGHLRCHSCLRCLC